MCGIWKYTICLAMMILESDSLPAHSLKSFILLIIVFHFNLILQFMKNKQSGSTTTYVQLTFWSFDSNFPGQYAARFRNTKKNEIQSPLQRLWRKKVASILLQTRNCTHYPSNSYDGRGKSECQTKLSWYVNFLGCNMCAFADKHFLPRPQNM